MEDDRVRENARALETAFTEKLKTVGFKKKARTWRKDFSKLSWIINLQKSAWGEQFYLNVNVDFRSLDTGGFSARGDLQNRAEQLISPERKEKLAQFLDCENHIPAADRLVFMSYVAEDLLAFLGHFQDEATVLEAVRSRQTLGLHAARGALQAAGMLETTR